MIGFNIKQKNTYRMVNHLFPLIRYDAWYRNVLKTESLLTIWRWYWNTTYINYNTVGFTIVTIIYLFISCILIQSSTIAVESSVTNDLVFSIIFHREYYNWMWSVVSVDIQIIVSLLCIQWKVLLCWSPPDI